MNKLESFFFFIQLGWRIHAVFINMLHKLHVKPCLKILSVLMKRQAVFCYKISTWDDIYFRLAIIKVVGNWTSMMINLTCNDLHDLNYHKMNHLFLLWHKNISAMAIFHLRKLPQNESSFSIMAKKYFCCGNFSFKNTHSINSVFW